MRLLKERELFETIFLLTSYFREVQERASPSETKGYVWSGSRVVEGPPAAAPAALGHCLSRPQHRGGPSSSRARPAAASGGRERSRPFGSGGVPSPCGLGSGFRSGKPPRAGRRRRRLPPAAARGQERAGGGGSAGQAAPLPEGAAARERCGGSFLLWKLPVAARREDRGSREAFRKGRARSPASGVTKMMPLPKRRVQAALGRGCRRGARADPPEAVVASGQSPERPVSEGRSLLFQRSRLWRPLFLSVSRNVCRCLVKCIVLFI